jgi:Acetyltransferases
LSAITIIKKLEIQSCKSGLLSEFNRYQEIKRCWRKENGKWLLKDIVFTEQWDDKEKEEKTIKLRKCLEGNGIVLGAFVGNNFIGFSSVSNRLFGSDDEYINLELLHVSYEYRRMGIGKMLFHGICGEVEMLGAKKLYITANSSEETQAFYKSMGCIEAIEINQELFEKEPFDCHLEFCL